jgi:hypothetical protein
MPLAVTAAELLAPALRHRFREHEPIQKRPSSRAAASDQESAMSKNRFLSSSVLASRAIRKNSSAMWRCSSAVVIDVLLLPLRSRLLFLHHVIGFCAFSRDPLSCSTIVAGQSSRMARACRRTPALMARLAMWKAGDYLLPPPTLRLRARLESGGIGGAGSRAAAVRTFHQL